MAYLAYYYFKKEDLKNGLDQIDEDIEKEQLYLIILKTLGVYLFISMTAKVQNLLKVFKEFGLLVSLIVSSFLELGSFLLIFFIWDIVFALIYQDLGTYEDVVDGTPELNRFIAFFFVSFGNSIGNI